MKALVHMRYGHVGLPPPSQAKPFEHLSHGVDGIPPASYDRMAAASLGDRGAPKCPLTFGIGANYSRERDVGQLERAEEGGMPRREGGRVKVFDKPGVVDNISRLLDAAKLVPKKFRGTDKYLDVVSWNIRWFDNKDPARVAAIADVLAGLNADVLVLTEIADDRCLDEVVDLLAKKKAGYYSTKFGSTGSQQRVVLMWDRDWVRSKEDPRELFGDENLEISAEFGTGRQRVFPRLPLWGYFEARAAKAGAEGFAFELMGLHMKAQGPAPQGYKGKNKVWGVPQRTIAAERLVRWLVDGNAHFDADVIIVGDWNATPQKDEWRALRDLEATGEVVFEKINKSDEASHLVRLNASGETGTRLDLHLVTKAADAKKAPKKGLGVVIRWSPFDHLSNLGSADRQALFKRLKKQFSDHLPVVSRFYLHEVP